MQICWVRQHECWLSNYSLIKENLKDLDVIFWLEFRILLQGLRYYPAATFRRPLESTTKLSVWAVTSILERSVNIDLIDGKVDILETLGKIIVEKNSLTCSIFKHKMLKGTEQFLSGNPLKLSTCQRNGDTGGWVSHWQSKWVISPI